jgi:hypothetical protein
MNDEWRQEARRIQARLADLQRRVEELERPTEPPSDGVDSSEEGGE